MIKLVVIDLDDTLSMTEKVTYVIENETAKEMGYPLMSRDAHLKNWGKPLADAITERIPGINATEFMKQVKKVHDRYVKEGKLDVLSKRNLAFLDEVLESGRKSAILTSRSLQEVKHLLKKDHPLHRRIEKFYHKDNSTHLKPDPRVFDQILMDFSVTPQETIYLGDSLGDAAVAKSAGLHFIAILESGLRKKEDFQAYPVDYFATTLPEALNYIKSQH